MNQGNANPAFEYQTNARVYAIALLAFVLPKINHSVLLYCS